MDGPLPDGRPTYVNPRAVDVFVLCKREASDPAGYGGPVIADGEKRDVG